MSEGLTTDPVVSEQSPRVVALIPCYNSRKFIRQTVLGLLNQTRRLDLIVVLDDMSTDGFEEEIQDLVDENEHLIVHHNPRNLGRSACRNEGLDCFPADFYILNDADDISLPHRVEQSLVFMQEHPNCGVMGGFVEYIDAHGKMFGKGTQVDCFTEEDARRYRESMKPVGLFCSTICLRSSAINGEEKIRFEAELLAAEDIDCWNRILEAGWDVLAIPKFLSQYRFHGDSICTSKFLFCHNYGKYMSDRIRRRRSKRPSITYEEFCDLQKKEGCFKRFKALYSAYEGHFYRTGGYHMVEGRWLRGGLMLVCSLLMNPKRIRRLIYQRLGKRLF